MTRHNDDLVLTVRTAIEEDLDDITRIHMAAVPSDPECPYRYPYREQFLDDHWRFSRAEYATYLHDELAVITLVEMARNSDDEDLRPTKPVAFSVCHLPGSHVGKSSESNARKIAESLKEEPQADVSPPLSWELLCIAIVPENLDARWIRRDANLSRMIAFQESISQAKSDFFTEKYGEGQVYLGMLACHPDYQRRGAGESLLRVCIARALADRLPVTLCASPMGLPLYHRLGFEVVGEFRTQVEGEPEFLVTPCMVLEVAPETS